MSASAIAPDGARIGWITVGQGDPILLVHGGAADHTRLAAFGERLSIGMPFTLWIDAVEASAPTVRVIPSSANTTTSQRSRRQSAAG